MTDNISLNIIIPLKYKDVFIEKTEHFINNKDFTLQYSYDEDHEYFLNLNINNNNNNNNMEEYIESFLDNIRKDLSNMRYNMLVYNHSNKWPKSIRINKQGNKIITKQQTKLCSF